MSGPMRAFVNERPVTVPPGASAVAAVEAHDPKLAARVASGEAYLTDGRGIRLEPDAPIVPGAILRVISTRTARDPDA
jgi:hypothetical protein